MRGAELLVPTDLCAAGTSAAGFRELTAEAMLQLLAPATGLFVERRVTKLMPNGALPVQVKVGGLAQLHAIGEGAIVQDSHHEGDVFVLQTVLPGPSCRERTRLALLFDSATGRIVRGMRSWQEIRWAQPGAERALSAAADSHVALAATWASAVAGTLIPTPAATSSTTAAPLPSESRIEMPGLGLTVHAAAGQLNIEKRDCDLVLQRRFDRGVCWVGGTETGGTSASARASITRLRGGGSRGQRHRLQRSALLSRRLVLAATCCSSWPRPALSTPSPVVDEEALEARLVQALESGGVAGTQLSRGQLASAESTVHALEAVGGSQFAAAGGEGAWELPFVGGWDVLYEEVGTVVGASGLSDFTLVSARIYIWGPAEISTECVLRTTRGTEVLLTRTGSVTNLPRTEVRLDLSSPMAAYRVSSAAAPTLGPAVALDTLGLRASPAGGGPVRRTTYLSERLWITRSECIDCGDTSELAVLRRTEAELAIRPPPRSLYGKVYSKRYSE